MMGILRDVYRNYFRYIENKVKPIGIRTPGGALADVRQLNGRMGGG
jgi:hypothetical protein